MPRIQFELPDHFVFATDIQIYISHVNQGGHLDNAQLLTLVSEARVRFFKSLGYTEGNVAGYPIVVGDMVAQYKSEGFHGETMRVSMIPQDHNKYGFDLVYRMECLDTAREVARGKIGIVFIERASRKVAAVPSEFLERVAKLPAHWLTIPDQPPLKIQRTMTDITIFHNPQCSSSRNALALIRDSGAEPTVVEYLKTPPSRDELLALVQRMGGSVRDVLRQRGTPYDELDLGNPKWTDSQLLDFIAQHPILIQRPIVATPLGVRICRPAETVLEILPKAQ